MRLLNPDEAITGVDHDEAEAGEDGLMLSTAGLGRWRLVENPPEEAACFLCCAEEQPVVETGIEVADGRRVLVCRDCAVRLARTFKIGTAAAAAALIEAEAERHELERRLADADVSTPRPDARSRTCATGCT